MALKPEFIGSIFTPDHPVDDPSMLFGRASDVRQMFAVYGASYAGLPILTGPPGIGKTSVLSIFAQALVGLITDNSVGGASSLLPTCRRFVIYVRCDESMSDASDLSAAILAGVSSQIQSVDKRRAHKLKSVEVSASFPIFGAKATWDSVATGPSPSATETLIARVEALVEQNLTDEVTVILDECEQLPWLSGLLGFTRQFLSGQIRFCIALRDYAATRIASAQKGDYRWPTWIPLTGLDAKVVRDFYDQASQRLSSVGILWQLQEEVVSRVARLSSGEPWYLHMVGWALLYDPDVKVEQHNEGLLVSKRVTLGDLSHAELQVIRGRLAGLHGELYGELCWRAAAREQVLRALARYPSTIIPRGFIRHIARKRISSAAQIVDFLLSTDPPVLLTDSGRRSLQFVDHQFRVFCRLAEPEHAGADEFAKQLVDSWVG